MEKTFYTIFKTFFKVGIILLGGGYVILPLLTEELVNKKKWLTSEELCEYYAISSSLPGVIAINTSVFTGRKLLGRKGAIAAICGIVLPSFLVITLIASILSEISSLKLVNNLFWGVGIGVITLLFLAIREMWAKCITDVFSICIYILCLFLALFKILPLYIVIIIAIIAGILFEKGTKK